MKKLISFAIVIVLAAVIGGQIAMAQETVSGFGTIRVSSNIPTSWVITGPDNFSGSGTSATYGNAMPSGADYFINFPTIEGYEAPLILPSISQTLNAGQTITWSVFYPEAGDVAPINNGPTPCTDNSAGSVVSGLPAMLTPGQQADFTVRYANTGDTVWHHGAWYFGRQKTSQNVVVIGTNPYQDESIGLTKLNPPAIIYPQGYESRGPTSADWTMKLTAPTAPGNYSIVLQMYYDGTDTLIADYKQTPETRPYACVLENNTYAIQQPSTYFGQPIVLNFTVAEPVINGTISVRSNMPTAWTVTPSNGANPSFRTTTQSTAANYSAVPDRYTIAPQTIAGYMAVISSSANGGAVSNSATQILTSGGAVAFDINYIPSIANLNPSSKTLVSVADGITGAAQPYTSNTIIKNGDTLTFQVTLINDGTADAQIQKIMDTPSANLTNMRNVLINKGNGFVSASNTGNTINVSGTLTAHGNRWLVKYDMTINAANSTQFDQFKNCATIYYGDSSGNKNLTRCFGPILFKNPTPGAPTFREVPA